MIARGICIVNKHLFNALGKNVVGRAATRRKKYESKLEQRKKQKEENKSKTERSTELLLLSVNLPQNSNKKKTEQNELHQLENFNNIPMVGTPIKTIVSKKPKVYSISKEKKKFNSLNIKTELDLYVVNKKLQLWKSQQDEIEKRQTQELGRTSPKLVISEYLHPVEDFNIIFFL